MSQRRSIESSNSVDGLDEAIEFMNYLKDKHPYPDPDNGKIQDVIDIIELEINPNPLICYDKTCGDRDWDE